MLLFFCNSRAGCFKKAWYGFWLCAILLGGPLAQAQGGKRMALVIGNAAYVGEKPLRNPGADAADVAAALQRAGISVQRHTNLGRNEMNRAIDSFMQAAEGAELAVVYYSGHGMQAAGEAFLIPTDAKISSERDVRSEGIRLGELMDDLEAKRIRNTLLIIDACRDNPYRSRTRSTAKGLARPKEMNGAFLVAYATADGTTADDGDGRNGAYTEQLLKQLNQANRKNLRDLMEDTQLAVEEATRGAQRPKTYGDSAKFRNVYLLASVVPERVLEEPRRPVQPAGPAAGEIEQQAWEAARSAKSEAAYRAYLAEYPEGRYAGAARVNLAALRPQTVPEPVRPSSSPSPTQARQAGNVFKDCADCPEMVVIPAGNGIPAMAIGQTEVTQGQWTAVMGKKPPYFKCNDCPMEGVSWDDIQPFIRKLNAKTGKTYRLPTEQEWEYACLGGQQTEYCGSNDVDAVAWHRGNSNSTQRVRTKQANGYGLYDMSGNVYEWTDSCENNCISRVLRGGDWYSEPEYVRAAFRNIGHAKFRAVRDGFRLARIAP